MELVLAIILFTILKVSIRKYIKRDLNVYERFFYGALNAALLMSIVLAIAFFLPNFSWVHLEPFLKLAVLGMVVMGILEAIGDDKN